MMDHEAEVSTCRPLAEVIPSLTASLRSDGTLTVGVTESLSNLGAFLAHSQFALQQCVVISVLCLHSSFEHTFPPG